MEINGQTVNEVLEYRQMGLSPEVMQAIDKKGYSVATPVQTGAIPYFMEWKDVIAKAPTGTGKTFAFGIPMVEHVDGTRGEIQALVLAPTRELALQIQEELRDLCAYKKGVRVVCLYGGQPIEKQVAQLKKHPQIVVATPGRLMDHMKRQTLQLSRVETVVLDEADRMLDMGFVQDVTHILDKMPQRRNLGMFSATISREVLDISWVYQRTPVEITVPADEENRPDIAQYRLDVDRGEKADVMARLLEMGGYERVIAFCNTKNMTDRLTGLLQMRGISCQAIHGDIQQSMREKTLQKFRNGKLRVLVATDVAARGLDIDDVDAVFNYDIPDENEYYIHRIGRTGRAKRHGVAFSLVSTVTEGVRLDEIQKITGSNVRQVYFNTRGDLVAAVAQK
ncbi:MAG: DEAD/DEAH box helicase [Lawsonibacter sp.]|jgi:ATP-dependent RNA helicase DeaD